MILTCFALHSLVLLLVQAILSQKYSMQTKSYTIQKALQEFPLTGSSDEEAETEK